MTKARYRGWEFKSALVAAIMKIASDLGVKRVAVTFKDSIPTAAIDRHGMIYITNIADDAVLTRHDLEKFTGFALHELLHRKFTTFDAIDTKKVSYLVMLHNGLEDAYIENRAVAEKLTGNAEGLLGTLIDTMAAEGLAEVTDWADPRQYPFALAVYARKHGTIKVPLAKGLKPIFDDACMRLNKCNSTYDTWTLAEWVYDQLKQIGQQQQPQQANAMQSGSDQSSGDQQAGDQQAGDGQSDAPTEAGTAPSSPDQGQGEGDAAPQEKNAPEVGEARSPVKGEKDTPKGKVLVLPKPRSTEPKVDVPESAKQCGSVSSWVVAKDAYHVGDYKRWTVEI